VPYDPNYQFQVNNQIMRQRQAAADAALLRRRGGSRGGGLVLLFLLIAAGGYVYVAHPELWHSLVAQAENLIHRVQENG
jgi:hypothetical protein